MLLPVVSKLLGSVAYGTLAQVQITLALLATFCTLGVDFAFVRFFAGESDNKKIREGFFSILIAGFSWSWLITLILFLFSARMAELLFGGIEATNIVKLIAITLPFFSFNFLFLFFFRTFRQMKAFSILMVAQAFSEIGMIVFFILSGWGIFGVVLGILLVNIAFFAIMLGMIIRQIGIGLPPKASFARIKDYLRFSLPLIPSALSLWVTNLSDRYVISAFLGMSATGIYSAAYNLGTPIRMFMGPLNTVLVPTVANLYDHGRVEEVKTHLAYSLKYFLMVAIPAAVGLSILAGPLLRHLATPEFVGAGLLVVPFVAPSMILWGYYGVMRQPINLVKKTGSMGLIWGIAGAANLGLNLVLVPRIGILGAALTTLLAFGIATGLTYRISSRYLKFNINWSFIAKSLAASGVMAGVIWLINPTDILPLVLACVAGAGVYFSVLFGLKGFTKKEVFFFRGLLLSLNPFKKAR
ncbi:MAG: oligosaccharide flippase family protein [Dehalococcoidales bacterium]|nr:oligosaccharide flippase family protein [Dehalococcoidales bacterium]